MRLLEQDQMDAFTQAILDAVEAEATKIGACEGERVLALVCVAMALAVDGRHGDVGLGQTDVVTLAEMVGAQMRDWALEDRLLAKDSVN